MNLNCVRVFLSDLLNIHTTSGAAYYTETLVLAIMENGKIELLIDVDTLVDEDRLNEETLRRSLVSDQVVSNHLLGLLSNLLGGLADLDTALQARSELALATATSLDLSLEDEAALVAQTRCDFSSLGFIKSELSFLDINAKLPHDELGLELVQVEETALHAEKGLGRLSAE